MKFRQSALRVIARTLAKVLEPPMPIPPSKWARENLVVPDGPRAGELWDPYLTPYLIEPLDMLGPDCPVNKVVVRKSAQTGFTTLGIAWIGHTIDRDPCRMAVVQPTDSALSEFLSEKLNLAISETKALKTKVQAQKSRSSQGSTTYTKRYPGGSLSCLIATSTADLRSKTLKKVFKDEASEYPDDLDGQGSPHAMISARYTSFLASGDWKELNISTPVLKGACYISDEFDAGDQRFWHVSCPHCGEQFTFEFDRKWFKFNDVYPYEAHYIAPCCGSVIEYHERNALVRAGEWIALEPAPGKFPSYHFDALSSPFVPWDEIAKKFIEAGDDPAKQKGFWNLTLGLPYELRTDTPDYTRLMERREDGLTRGHIPPQGLLLVMSADVQMRGIYVEVLAIAPDRQSWVVDVQYLDGETTDAERGAFAKLTELYERTYPDAFGNRRRVDLIGVDSGYQTNTVYTWCRNRPGAMALKGEDGWSRPALGSPTLQDIDYGGRKIKKGAQKWTVGTWPLKATFYSDLRKDGLKAGREIDPPGYCHFGTWLDEVYFRQITSEYVSDEKFKGRNRKVWKIKFREENHWLDCRVYNMALAEYLGLSRMTADDWAVLAKERGVPKEARAVDLLSPSPVRAAASEAAKEAAPEPAPVPKQEEPAGNDWFKGRNRGWFNKR
ncbi:terminase GpA [Rhodomicrobium udaipurense JA643]|uniref:Phage terminase large subunit family protein n=1 Tax=Rhodomicrobium udaipurense TaxID=1202716 RepID=A0A8I1KJR6_9HYPH|nr:terminase gpA endonuclease subunit [Rhodomicrobium udaipurense]KAI93927.1 terminase GpA [Rhodomicrobium udaipurense JA643]MBJ7543251.1 phage terminase large subunit family protein [Rhodomicrobium udaipurense]